MRRFSKKRQKLNRETRQWRENLRLRVGRCEFCLKKAAPEHLDVDEIARGCCRSLSLTVACAVLVVHRQCHSLIQTWSRARRLAILLLARPKDYDLDEFWALTDRNWPDQEDVDREIEFLLAMRTANKWS